MVTLGVRGGRPIHRQLLRGVAITVALLVGLLLVATAVPWLLNGDGFDDLSAPRRLAVAGTWVGLAAGLTFTWRRLRRWSERPRWLVPAAAAIVVAGLVPAVVMQAPVQPGFISHCVPVADAWRPVMARPSAADVAYMTAHPKPSHVSLNVMTRQQRDAFDAAFNVWLSSPAYAHMTIYSIWQDGPGPCAVPSRAHLGWSAAGLGVGAAGLTVAVRRRRSV
jgi:hypothetical protein